jgi:hypothetical protein
MFGESQVGPNLKWSDDLLIHKPVEEFFLEVMGSYPTKPCFDLSCQEPMRFWSMNYSLYAGFFMMAPLQNEIREYQIQEALCSGTPDGFDYVNYFSDKVSNGAANKYIDRQRAGTNKYKCLVVLTGSNCLTETVELGKLRWIVEEYGALAAIKPHPLTTESDIEKLRSELLPNANILQPDDDVYEVMRSVDTVYTTHSSETALYSVCSGKSTRPLSSFGKRMGGSFAHINEHLFSTLSPKGVVNKLFSDPRAGLVHPEIHSDWQDKIVEYLEYIHKLRQHLKHAYK